MNDKKMRLLIGLLISSILIFFGIMQYKKIRERDITFRIAGDIISYATRGDDLIGLTESGTLIVYDNKGKEKKTIPSDIIYLSQSGYLFYIKKDGSIVTNIDDNFNGEVIGKIPGAVSGCFWYDMFAIVTDKGELYFRADEEILFQFNNSIIVDGWTKINDVSDVKKALLVRNSGENALMILNKKGEVYFSVRDKLLKGPSFNKISEDVNIVDISNDALSFLMLDDQGNVYEMGRSMFSEQYSYIDHMSKVNSLCNVMKISSDHGLGAALTIKGDVYIWGIRDFTKGKAYYFRTIFETLFDEEYENIIASKYLYAIKGDKVRRINYESHFKK